MSNLQEVPTDELLVFHDFPVVHQQSVNQAEINVNEPEQNDPLERNESKDPSKVSSIWSLEYYQRFFDVDTEDVTQRILHSLIPKNSSSLLARISQKPDLYGPFWISTTLIFTIAVSGNISNYLQHENEQWRYDFKLVSYAATAIWIYLIFAPLILWTLLTTFSSEAVDEELKPPSIFELICIYGYSLFIYIPIAILWSIQISNLQWFLVIISSLCSGSVLITNLSPTLQRSKHRILLTLGIVLCHLALSAGFMLYFFYAPNNNNHVVIKLNAKLDNETSTKM